MPETQFTRAALDYSPKGGEIEDDQGNGGLNNEAGTGTMPNP